jgi:hypothetical protein
MPGKSQLTFLSFNFTGYRNGTNKRIGLFDDKNGIWIALKMLDYFPKLKLSVRISP